MSLPLAPNRATISNRISLLLSSRASLLKSLNPTSPSQPTIPRRHDDEEDFKGGRPNEGVGYVPDKNSRALSRENKILLGKRTRGGRTLKKEEEEEDEEEGRSGVGRRKRRKEDVKEEAQASEPVGGETATEIQGEEADARGKEVDLLIKTTDGSERATDGASKKKKNKKRKSKT